MPCASPCADDQNCAAALSNYTCEEGCCLLKSPPAPPASHNVFYTTGGIALAVVIPFFLRAIGSELQKVSRVDSKFGSIWHLATTVLELRMEHNRIDLDQPLIGDPEGKGNGQLCSYHGVGRDTTSSWERSGLTVPQGCAQCPRRGATLAW